MTGAFWLRTTWVPLCLRCLLAKQRITDTHMLTLTINGAPRTLAESLSLAELLERLGYDRRRIAVEVNREVIPLKRHGEQLVADGDAVEIVTLVGGGAAAPEGEPADKPLVIGKFTFRSRLITGTGKYATYDLMRDCLAASGCEATTVAIRRERLVDKEGRNILDYLDLKRYTILPSAMPAWRESC
jgi:thiazole synthase